MHRRTIGTAVLSAAAVVASVGAIGCSTTTDAKSTREVSPDGKTATQTRTRVRETPSGAKVRETETQRREVLTPATQSTTPPDARKRDPGM